MIYKGAVESDVKTNSPIPHIRFSLHLRKMSYFERLNLRVELLD